VSVMIREWLENTGPMAVRGHIQYSWLLSIGRSCGVMRRTCSDLTSPGTQSVSAKPCHALVALYTASQDGWINRMLLLLDVRSVCTVPVTKNLMRRMTVARTACCDCVAYCRHLVMSAVKWFRECAVPQ